MTQTSLIDINSLINSKNKSSKNWYEHNFLFNKISGLLGEKLKELGLSPQIKIIVHGLTLQQAKVAETAAIALLGKDNLANVVKGSRSNFTNASPREIIDHYNAKEVVLKHRVIMIIRNPWNPDLPEYEHYDRTRSAWRLGSKKDLAQYAFLVHQGIVKRIYTVTAWYPDGTTFHSRNNPDPNNPFYRKCKSQLWRTSFWNVQDYK